jgi:hypothetical protein
MVAITFPSLCPFRPAVQLFSFILPLCLRPARYVLPNIAFRKGRAGIVCVPSQQYSFFPFLFYQLLFYRDGYLNFCARFMKNVLFE